MKGKVIKLKKITVNSKNALKGEIKIHGSKNASLPILAATLLCNDGCVIKNVPPLTDINNMNILLKESGVITSKSKEDFMFEVSKELTPFASYENTVKLRASFLLAGPLLAKTGYTQIAYPGGCKIGARPIDLHLKGFEKLGASILNKNGYIELKSSGLKGTKIYLDFPSVGATENIMCAAVTANGKTVIENAAAEPEIKDLADFINKMGGEIMGAGTDTITINGVETLNGGEYTVIPDRIEAGTYMIIAASTRGKIRLTNVIPEHLASIIAKLKETGTTVTTTKNTITTEGKANFKACDIKTLPYPGFPTDLQAQFCAMMTKAKGTSVITETIFENRFMHIGELKRLGAKITADGHTAIIEGVSKLTGAELQSSDLRAGASLVTASLMAEGPSVIRDNDYISRGYCDFVKNLKSLGADIKEEIIL